MRARWLRALPATVRLLAPLSFGQRVRLWAPNELTVGKNVRIGSDVRIEVDGAIGDDVLIANGVAIIGRRDHDMSVVGVPITSAPWVGTTPELSAPTSIGSDVWVGFGAIILSGVSIGDSAVVAAGAVVTRNVAPNAIVAGNPAKVVGQRFDASELEEHWRALRRDGVRLASSGDQDSGNTNDA